MSEPIPDFDCDLLVIGSGAAGLAAAVTAAAQGLQVVVAEKEPVLGGTTAWSGGWIWAPCNPAAHRDGITEDPAHPRQYLQAVLGRNFDAVRVDAFLRAAPQMVRFFEEETALEFQSGSHIPDTYGDQPGAGTGGRSVIAAPFDGRRLGSAIGLLRRPAPETSFMGMTIQAGPDLRAFMTMLRSVRSFAHVTRRFTRHLMELARYGRGMQLRNGNALVARLMRAALDLRVDLRVSCAASDLIVTDGMVTGAVLEGRAVTARRGVVLATGGFPHDAARRANLFPQNDQHLTLAVPSATGDGLRMGENAGGQCDTTLAAPGAWCPVSKVPWRDGSFGQFPHIIERGKPGLIGVLANGQRFCNEGLGYYDYVDALLRVTPEGGTPVSWMICDQRFLNRYGLGIARPKPLSNRYWIKSGYLKTGRTLTDLARACGIDAEGLAATVSRFNEGAARGEDPEFHRGTTPYMRLQGDPDVGPNPCLAPIVKPPFYAVQVEPGSFGTFAGLKTDGSARVLGADGAAIPGLYAAGTDMASVMGGHYPAGGINLGPALTFGFIAGRHAAEGAS